MIKLIKSKTQRINHWLVIAFFVLPTPTFAASIESIINNATRFLQGTLAKAVGVVVIVASGYLCIAKQKLPKEQFAMILIGLGIIFGGSSLYNTLVG